MRIVFFGTPDFAVPALRALAAERHELALVVTRPDRPRGRGRSVGASPVKDAALALGLPVAQPASVNAPDAAQRLESAGADVFVVVAFGAILSRALLAMPRRAALNLHPSLLPALRGPAPIERAIWNACAWTGLTVQYMSTALDAGDLLAQRAVAIGPEETAGELSARLAGLGAQVVCESLALLAAGRAARVPQDATRATWAPALVAADGVVRWESDVFEVAAQIRAVTPRIGARTVLDGREVIVHRARPIDHVPEGTPGEVAYVSREDGIVVSTGRGRIGLLELQAAGRRPLPAWEFARGARVATGARCVSPASASGVVASRGSVQ